MKRLFLALFLGQTAFCNPLWNALRANRFDQAKALVRKGHGVDSLEGDQSTPLFQAVQANHNAAVRFLIDNGAAIDGTKPGEPTPLMAACEAGNFDIAASLIAAGASVNAAVIDRTPLTLAIRHDRGNLVKLLLDKGADPNIEPPSAPDVAANRSALFEALHAADTAIFQQIFQREPDANRRRSDGTSLLMEAASAGSLPLVRYLLNLGAKVDAVDKGGASALLRASASRADSSILEILLEKGAHPNLSDSGLRTPLMLAAEAGDATKVRTLLRWKSDVNALDRQRETAISKAIAKRQSKVVGVLIQAGAKPGLEDSNGRRFLSDALYSDEETLERILPAIGDVNMKIYQGDSKDSGRFERILPYAARRGWNRVVSLALSRGANPFLRDRDSLTPLELSFEHKNHDAFGTIVLRHPQLDSALAREYLLWYVQQDDASNSISFLVKKGGRADARTDKGRTPLMIAAENGQMLNMKVLIKSKADLSLRDIAGRSALHFAISAKCRECVDLLLGNGASVKIQDRNKVTPVTEAILASDTAMARLLISKGGKCIDAPALFPFAFDEKTEFGITGFVLNRCKGLDLGRALLVAVANGDMAKVEELVSRKADVNARDEMGRTPLMVNGYGPNREAIHDLLVNNGAKLKIRDKNGNTAESYYAINEGE